MSSFTPVSGLIGGLLIGTAAVCTLWTLGRLAGISHIAHSTLAGLAPDETRDDWLWRPAFLLGLIVAGALFARFTGTSVTGTGLPPAALVAGGLLVGWGTAQGRGCTSGHGVCGLARLSTRSLVATLTFMATGALTVWLSRHLGVPA
jgi:uncharacterized membrane protein YedE/YeeE